MRIEKINENKIRIFLNLDDLKEKNIDIHSFMSSPIESQSLFLDVLQMAEEKVGFVTKDYKISIEAIAMSYGDFVLTVTRDKELSPKKRKQFQIKRKSEDLKQIFSIFAFDSFDDFIEFAICFKNSRFYSLNKFIKQGCLYELNSTYYFVFETPEINIEFLKGLYGLFAEFSKLVFDSDLFVNKLQEYGKLIIKNNAIGIINKNFIGN